MKQFFQLACFCMIGAMLSACGVTTPFLRGHYETTNSIITTTHYDQVWSNVIDFFAEHNIPIGTLSKESGLITANNVAINESSVSYEDKNGQIVNPQAWFVLPYIKGVVGGRVTCSFNVRVKKVDEHKTSIQINLSNPIGYYNLEYLNTLTFKKEIIYNTVPRTCQSTGNFESLLLALFK